jgi:ribosomal protein S18 acetylase RimI-like enzyme
MRIDVSGLVPADLTDLVWRLYNDAFSELRTTAVQRHIMVREEFNGMMQDGRVAKYMVFDNEAPDNEAPDNEHGGRLCGLGTMTNELDAMPLISPDYFRRRWPTHFAEGRIWYIGFVAVHPDYRGTGLFEILAQELYRVVSAQQGVAALDVCRRNEQIYRLPQALHRFLENSYGFVRSDRMDEQSYWFYEFPAGP